MIEDFKKWSLREAKEVEPDDISVGKSLDPEWLRSLKDHPNRDVRGRVAYHQDTPLDVRVELAGDSNKWVRSWAAFGAEHLPEEWIRKLAQDPESVVRDEIARGLSTPADLLEQLAEDPEEEVRLSVVKNPRCSITTLTKLTLDGEPRVRNRAKLALQDRDWGIPDLLKDF